MQYAELKEQLNKFFDAPTTTEQKKKDVLELLAKVLNIGDTDTADANEVTRFAHPNAQRDNLAQSVQELQKALFAVYGVKNCDVWAISPTASAENLAETNRILRGAIMDAYEINESAFHAESNVNDEGEILDALEETRAFINSVLEASTIAIFEH